MEKIRVTCDNHEVYPYAEIKIEGFETFAGIDDCIIYLENYEGEWTLYVYADINQEDATHVIPLGDAHKTHRRDRLTELLEGL